jgi:hypothetical protein
MNAAVENALYFLVIDRRADDAIFVFIGADPGPDQPGEPVLLELLPPHQRFVGGGGVAIGRPPLGRWPGGLYRFRQFLTVSEMEQGGWLPVSQYRICDSWTDYFNPWLKPAHQHATMSGSTAHEQDRPDDTAGA